ncbi:MAG: hypothetical protein ACQCN6_09190 [Candidatus Bathyarchaeia archaeon]|jgi:hypothetical protein
MVADSDFPKHECDLQLNECKRIDVIYFQDVSYKNKKLMNGLGVDGVLYTFEVVPRKAIPLMEPINRRKFTERIKKDGTDEDFTKPVSLLQKRKWLAAQDAI